MYMGVNMDNNTRLAVSNYLTQMEKDLHIPINTIIGNVEQISKENANAGLHDNVVNIRRSTEMLVFLTNDLIDIVRIGNDELVIADEDYDFEDVVLDVRRNIEKKTTLKGIENEINIDNNIPCRFFGDKSRVGKMLRRLIKHAVDVTEKGKVTFSASCMPGVMGSMFLRFDISDNGSGELSEDVAATLAGRAAGENVSRDATTVFIIKYIAGRMGGKFSARAKRGEGCTFTLLISQKPVGCATFKDRMLESDDEDDGGRRFVLEKKLRVLVIGEDKEVALHGQQAIYGYKIGSDITYDPEEALQLLMRIKYDAVIVSENLKLADGTGLIDAIRGLAHECPDKEQYFNRLPIIAVESVYGAEAAPVTGTVNGRITVPMQKSDLEELLIKLLPAERLKYNSLHNYSGKGIESLRELGLNSAEAFARFGSDEEEYRRAVLSVCRSSDTKGKMLNYYLEQSDYKNYIIIIRSMLEVTQLIGSESLSKEARELEKAVKYNPGPELLERTAQFAEDFENVLASVRSVMTDASDNANKGAIDREDLIYLINELRGYLSNYQINEVEELFFTLAQFSYEDSKVMEIIHEAEEHMLEYNYNEVMVSLDKLIARIQN